MQKRYLEKRAPWKLEVGFESKLYPASFLQDVHSSYPSIRRQKAAQRFTSLQENQPARTNQPVHSKATKEEMMFHTSGWNGVRSFEIGLNLGGVNSGLTKQNRGYKTHEQNIP